MMNQYVLLIISLFYLKYSFACNGYSVKLNHYKNCVDNPVIKLPAKGASVALDKDCNLILIGCLEITKPFKTAKGTYTVKKAPLPPMEGDLDFCEVIAGLDDPNIGKVAEMYGMPKGCPVPQKKICGTNNKKISIAQFKNQLGMASGTIEAKLEATHDTGKTCIDVGFTVSRVKSG